MTTQLEKLLNQLPKKKLSRVADFKIRFRLLKIQLKQSLQLTTPSFALNWQTVLAIFLIAIVSLSSTGVYAYTSENVNRQSPLYPIKRTLENIEKSTAKNPTAQSNLQAKLAARRLAEAKTLIAKSTNQKDVYNDVEITLREARENIKSSNEGVESINDETDQEQAIKKLDVSNQENTKNLEQIAEKLSLDDDEKIVDAVANTLNDLDQQQIIYKKHANKKIRSEIKSSSTIDTQHSDKPNSASRQATTTITKKAEKTDDNESLKQIKKQVELFKKEQASKRDTNPKTEKLIKNLQKKLDQAENSIKQGDKEGFLRLYQSTSALANTGNHFIAPSSTKTFQKDEKTDQNKEDLPEKKRTSEQKKDSELNKTDD